MIVQKGIVVILKPYMLNIDNDPVLNIFGKKVKARRHPANGRGKGLFRLDSINLKLNPQYGLDKGRKNFGIAKRFLEDYIIAQGRNLFHLFTSICPKVRNAY